MKVGGARWTPLLLLALLLSARGGSGAVDSGWLANIVEELKKEYPLGDTLSLAANIPENQDASGLRQVLRDDPVARVRGAVARSQVYHGVRLIAAAQSGGLSRVLESVQPLIKSSEGNVLVIYSEDPPSVTDRINDVVRNWHGYAFAFSRVAADPSGLARSFRLLEASKLGLGNVFRCYAPGDSFECTSCSSGGGVAPSCLANAAPSGQGGEASDDETDVGTEGGTGGDADSQASTEVATGGEAGVRGQGKAGRVGGYRRGKGRGCERRGGRQRRKGCKRQRGGKLKRGRKLKKGRKQGRKQRVRGKRGRGGSRKKRRGGAKARRRRTKKRRGGKRWGELLEAVRLS